MPFRHAAFYILCSGFLTQAGAARAEIPTLGPGPKVKIATVTQSGPTIPQYTKVDVPYFKEIVPQKIIPTLKPGR